MSRQKVEKALSPKPCAGCGRAARLIVNGKRICWLCFGTVKQRREA